MSAGRIDIPRGLSEDEAAAWAKLAHSVTPMAGRVLPPISAKNSSAVTEKPAADMFAKRQKMLPETTPRTLQTPPRTISQPVVTGRPLGLDGSWERKLRSGQIAPDFTLDLHGHTLDSAHSRLDSGMMQARAMDARVVLLIAGKSRPVEAADRGSRRGAIRAKILDWLAAGPHGNSIAAVRKAHRRHGGEGALYLILKRRR